MFRLIFKNLWARRRRNGWLLAELMLVSILTWIVFDPILVNQYDRHRPAGYDVGRLCSVTLSCLHPNATAYDPQAADSAGIARSLFNLLSLARNHPDVEQATVLLGFTHLGGSGFSSNSYRVEGDTTKSQLNVIQFYYQPGTNFFETYGIAAHQGMTQAELSAHPYAPGELILTRNALQMLFGTDRLPRQRLYNTWRPGDTTFFRVVATTADVKPYLNTRPTAISFVPNMGLNTADVLNGSRILLRLRPGVSMERFTETFRPWMVSHMRAGNLFALSLQTMEDEQYEATYRTSVSLYRRNLLIASFFLINLCLGVIGTFWLQTRARREEVGIMLSFGATPRRIIGLLMGEGAMLTFVAVLAGCLIYLPYALSEGLNMGTDFKVEALPCWVDNFALHYLLVSGFVFVLLLIVVLLGVYLPARQAASIAPTDALRDE